MKSGTKKQRNKFAASTWFFAVKFLEPDSCLSMPLYYKTTIKLAVVNMKAVSNWNVNLLGQRL